jgi:integrase
LLVLTIRLVRQGDKELPEDATADQVWAFLRSGGRLSETPRMATRISLDALSTAYFDSLPDDAKEASSLATERTHIKHLKRHLGASTPIREVGVDRLQGYVKKRQGDKGLRGKSIKADTIKKELQTFRQLWAFAAARDYVRGSCPVDEVAKPKSDQRTPFKTWDEIEAIIKRGGYDEGDQKELWECLFLREHEVLELLDHVRRTSRQAFVYPMIAFAALTGARRSEIIRSEVEDFRLDEGVVWIREKKRRQNARISYRDVALHPKLKAIMAEWFERHPGGRYTICASPGIRSPGGDPGLPRPLTPTQAHDHFRRALADSKWKVVRGFHVFRHSLASQLARKGIHQSVIDRTLGHQTPEMRDRYRHLFPEEKREAIGALSSGIAGLFSG